jgi:hypothetical protein
MIRWLICLILLSAAWGQSGTLKNKAVNGETPKPLAQADDQLSPAQRIPQDATIITIDGLCDRSSPVAFKPSCKTTMTRAQFEKILFAIQPESPQAARRQFANDYTNTLVKARKARELGLDKQPDFDSRVEVLRLVVTKKALETSINIREWDKISDKQIEDYYRSNPQEFIQVNLEKLFVPWFEPDDDPKNPLSETEKKKRDEQGFRDLRVEAEKLYQRALAGEDFLPLQIEANKFTDSNNGTSTRGDVVLERFRRKMFTPALVPVMDVEPGHLTPILTEDNGYYIFKVTKKSMMPLEKVRLEIHGTLRDPIVDKFKADIVQSAASSTVFNPDYFGPSTPADQSNPPEKNAP